MDDMDYFLREQTHIYVSDNDKYCGYVCYYTSKDMGKEIYNSYSAAKYFKLPYISPEFKLSQGPMISYQYDFGKHYYQVGFTSKHLNEVYDSIQKIKTAIKNKGFKVCEEEPFIRYWWTQFAEYRALRIISEWFEEIRSNPEYKYCRKRLDREYNNLDQCNT